MKVPGLSLVAVFAALLLFSGCSHVDVKQDSPRVAGFSVESSSNGTEQSQRVKLTVVFDRPIVVEQGAGGDFAVKVDGATLDPKTVLCGVSQGGNNSLVITLSPASRALGPKTGTYFALHYGGLTVEAADVTGGLKHVRSSTGASAVLRKITCRIPSGLKIAVVSSTPGGNAGGQPATATFRVLKVPQVRVVSWVVLSSGGREVYVHNHEFLTYSVESYAQYLAGSLQQTYGGEYVFTAKGDQVTVKAAKVTDGQALEPTVDEVAR